MKEKRKIKTKHSNIFEYFKDKCITENGELTIEVAYNGHDPTKANISNSIPVIEDWGEPCCFACNAWTGVALNNQDGDLTQLWDNPAVKRQLQRAHIIPDALGGSDTASNLFCLCRRCHRDSPDTLYASEFFRWVYLRRKEGQLTQRALTKAINECKKRNINPSFIHTGTTFDMTFETMGSHGGSISESSFVASLVGGALERQKALDGLLYSTTEDDRKKAMINFAKCFNIDYTSTDELSF